jgi:hypothetical protein
MIFGSVGARRAKPGEAYSLVGDTIALRITSNGEGDTYETTHWIDNISVAVPEPGTMSLLALGGLAILRRRRRA